MQRSLENWLRGQILDMTKLFSLGEEYDDRVSDFLMAMTKSAEDLINMLKKTEKHFVYLDSRDVEALRANCKEKERKKLSYWSVDPMKVVAIYMLIHQGLGDIEVESEEIMLM
ncbi:hypothetical protein FKW77_005543 [Venturia effusa]|uniref:Uncharacterized protein n=1 Tax=Venturia effusa TaxID=50376 RepID=A0A517L1D2_9PEZI|nr:hypothetical protein FKW77_005543 [Venturia effusa]